MGSESNVVETLTNLEPGKIPPDIFNQVARLTVTPVLEVVPFFYRDDGSLSVYLQRRDPSDKLWPNKYYIPGSIISATDEPGSFSDALGRVLEGKLSGLNFKDTKLVGVRFCKVARGSELAVIFSTQIVGSPNKSFLYDPYDLPTDMIEGHEDFIQLALRELI